MEQKPTEAGAVAELTQRLRPWAETEIDHIRLLQNGYTLQNVEKQLPARVRERGTLKTPRIRDFGAFFSNHANGNTPIFVDGSDFSATAIFNYDVDGQQGHCDHLAVVTLQKTVTWEKLTTLVETRNVFNQRNFAVWMEDWQDVLTVIGSDGDIIAPGVAIATVRDMSVEQLTTTGSTVSNTGESRSKFDSVEAKAKGIIPAYFLLRDACYSGLVEKEIKLRLVVSADGDKPSFTLQIVKQELIEDALVQEFIDAIQEVLGAEANVLAGVYSA